MNLDVEEPYAMISTFEEDVEKKEKRILIPKSLAYYLVTHWCGSEVIKENIEENIRYKIKNIIMDALGIK